METKKYSLKEVAYALNRSGTVEENDRLIRCIRHWTTENLLKPVGAKHTGTGKSRRYSEDTVYRAAVLVELHKWKVPMTILASAFATFTDDCEYTWEVAKNDGPEGVVYLAMTWAEHEAEWVMQIDFPLVHLIEEDFEATDPDAPEPINDGNPVPASMIVMNLSRLLRWVKL